MRAIRLAFFALLLSLPAAVPAAVPDPLKDASAAILREDFPQAEKLLRANLKLHPASAETMSLLGMALDAERKLAEADALHKRAIAAAPRSATILARYGQHLLVAGDPKGARETLQQALALDPADRFANLQFAQAAIRQKDFESALNYLGHIPVSQQETPEVAAARLVALDSLPGKQSEANALFARLSAATENDPNAAGSIGWTLAQSGQYAQAETFLTRAHAAAPADFHVLYDLGVVALYASHYDRAKEVLETARREQPNNADVLYSLAFAESALHKPDEAIRWLAQAGEIAPQRADIQRLLAVTANELNAFEDSAAAWDRYSKLAPNDDEARRERGFAKIHIGKFDEGIADIEWFVDRHPNDAMGHYELGVAQSSADPTQGIANIDKALALKPDFPAARAVRGSLNYQQGKPELALPDLEAVAAGTRDSAVLDRLGQTYVALNRIPDAIRVLRRAVDLPGAAPTVLLHLANALAEAGQTEESEALLARYKQARPTQGPVDLMHFLSLSPAEQRADYRARVEKAIHDNPRDAVAQSRLLKILLEENQMAQAATVARTIADLKPPAGVLADAGRALLEAKQYGPAKNLLAGAGNADVDLAIATFHAAGGTAAASVEGLRQLDRAPEAARNAPYYLARAQMLNAGGKVDDALAALRRAIGIDPSNPELYWQTAILLTQRQRAPEALSLLDDAAKKLPQDPSIPLTRAAVLELSGKTEEALKLADDLQRQAPEIAAVWVAKGMILAAHKRFDEARRALDTAVTHGARSPEANAPGNPTNPLQVFETRPPREW